MPDVPKTTSGTTNTGWASLVQPDQTERPTPEAPAAQYAGTTEVPGTGTYTGNVQNPMAGVGEELKQTFDWNTPEGKRNLLVTGATAMVCPFAAPLVGMVLMKKGKPGQTGPGSVSGMVAGLRARVDKTVHGLAETVATATGPAKKEPDDLGSMFADGTGESPWNTHP